MSDGGNVYCPECGGEMSFDGYRPLFPSCVKCGETFHYEECVKDS
jgi:uncharacterized protein (DUF983 family)